MAPDVLRGGPDQPRCAAGSRAASQGALSRHSDQRGLVVLKKSLRNFKKYTLVPIPVSPEKYQSRGFNQVEGFLQAAGLPYKHLLEKQDVLAQSSKNREERLKSGGK